MSSFIPSLRTCCSYLWHQLLSIPAKYLTIRTTMANDVDEPSLMHEENLTAEIVRLRQLDPVTLLYPPQKRMAGNNVHINHTTVDSTTHNIERGGKDTQFLYLTRRMDNSVFRFVLDTMGAVLAVSDCDALFSPWNCPKSVLGSSQYVIIDDTNAVQPQYTDRLCKLLNNDGAGSFPYTGKQLLAMIDVATHVPMLNDDDEHATDDNKEDCACRNDSKTSKKKPKLYLILVQRLPSILTESVDNISERVAAGQSLTPLLHYTWECFWMSM